MLFPKCKVFFDKMSRWYLQPISSFFTNQMFKFRKQKFGPMLTFWCCRFFLVTLGVKRCSRNDKHFLQSVNMVKHVINYFFG